MDFINIFLGILTFYFVGSIALTFFNIKNLNGLEFIALSYGIGSAAIVLQVILYLAFFLSLSPVSLLLPWIIIFFFVKKKIIKNNMIFNFKKQTLTSLEMFFIVLIFLNVVIAIIYSVLTSVTAWDAVANWSMLAKAIYFKHSLNGELYRFFNFDIPPFTSMQQAYLSFFLGKYEDRFSLLIFPCYYVSLLLLFYSFVKRHSSRQNALLFTFLLSSLPVFLRQAGRFEVGYTDIVLSFFLFASVTFLFRMQKEHSYSLLFLAGIFGIVPAIIKNEGTFYTIIYLLLITSIIVKKKNYKLLFFLLPGIFLITTWKYFTIVQNFPVHYMYSGTLKIERLPLIFLLFFKEGINVFKWHLLWAIGFISFIYSIRKPFWRKILIIIVLQLFFYMGIYLYTPLDAQSHLEASLDRFFLQIIPLVVSISAFTFYEVRNNLKSK